MEESSVLRVKNGMAKGEPREVLETLLERKEKEANPRKIEKIERGNPQRPAADHPWRRQRLSKKAL